MRKLELILKLLEQEKQCDLPEILKVIVLESCQYDYTTIELIYKLIDTLSNSYYDKLIEKMKINQLKQFSLDENFDEYRKKLQEYSKKISKSPEEAKKLLEGAGIIDKDGNLSEYYME